MLTFVPTAIHRSGHRNATITFRVSTAERCQIKNLASEMGCSVQALLEMVLLRREPKHLLPGPADRTHQVKTQELPLDP